MKLSTIAEWLWGSRSHVRWLLFFAAILLFSFLGAKEIWTQEHRWADIVAGMFYRHDFYHPYLGDVRYYDKPLLSYWMIALLSWLNGGLTTWALRLPSALAGLLAVWSIYRIGNVQRDKGFGILCGAMLVTTFYFVFWARVSSADMLNLGGILFAVAWYAACKTRATFFDYAIFFLILAVTALCKGLSGVIVPVIVVFADMCLQRSFKQHLRPALFAALIPATLVYLLPFWLSSHFGGEAYGENGLYLVYKENFLRYFQPFDHVGPIYTYFIYLPLYLMPWTLFFLPALLTLPRRWKSLSLDAKWNVLSLLFLFVFFTASGSRRSYYVLPIVPFAILVTADWIASCSVQALRQRLAALCAVISFAAIFVVMDVGAAWYYSHCGVAHFAESLKKEAQKQKPWSAWQVVMLDAESKLNFYLQLPPETKHYGVQGDRTKQTLADLKNAWPVLSHPPAGVIIISRKLFATILDREFPQYEKISLPSANCSTFHKGNEMDQPIAYIPR